MKKGYNVEEDCIVINRELTSLDVFLKDFLEILKKYSDYLVVSGFVSISSGRVRGTEDIDILVEIFTKERFIEFFNDLDKNGFWCYQGDNGEEAYEYVKNLDCIRFARKNEMFPNIEFISINKTKKAKYYEYTHPQRIRINEFEFKIPPIEFEIIYKEVILTGKKDIEDARHLRTFFSDIIDIKKFDEYEKIIRSELK